MLTVLATLAMVVLATGWFVLTQRVEGHYFDSAGARLHYSDEGQGDAVILLHGFAVNADLNWRLSGIVDGLKGRFRLVIPDLRGHGLSAKPHTDEAYGAAMVADVTRLMEHLQIHKAHLVGYSLGGFIVLRFAVDQPQRLRSAVLLGAGWEPPDNSAFLAAIPALQRRLRQGRSIGPLSEYLGGPRAPPSTLHAWSVHLMTGYFNDPLALAALLEGLPGITVSEAELRYLHNPVLAIVGENDPFRVSASALCGRLADYRMVIVAGVDHVRLASTERTIASLARFLTAPQAVASQCPERP